MAEEKTIKKQSFKVIKQFTFDKIYNVGSIIELSDKKTINNLISNNLIK
jgi:hypothetical protein